MIESLSDLGKLLQFGIDNYEIEIQYYVSDYGIIGKSAFAKAFDNYRGFYPKYKFGYAQVS